MPRWTTTNLLTAVRRDDDESSAVQHYHPEGQADGTRYLNCGYCRVRCPARGINLLSTILHNATLARRASNAPHWKTVKQHQDAHKEALRGFVSRFPVAIAGRRSIRDLVAEGLAREAKHLRADASVCQELLSCSGRGLAFLHEFENGEFTLRVRDPEKQEDLVVFII